MPVVTIDGQAVTVPADTTILEAARKAKVWIPTLCHAPALTSQGSCRICMVAIERRGRSELVTACNYPVRGDLVVNVEDERAVRVRKGVLELLMARSPGSQQLEALAARMGVPKTRYPAVTQSVRSCILCGLCVAVCEEVIGASAIGFQGRGVERVVAEPFGQATGTCIACGACAAVCPVGTIEVHVDAERGVADLVPFHASVPLQKCEACGQRTVSPALAAATAAKMSGDWEGFRNLPRLCPQCRRKQAAAGLALAPAGLPWTKGPRLISPAGLPWTKGKEL